NVGTQINVRAAATDADGNTLSFAWAVTGGTFLDPTAQTIKYNCSAGGTQSITLSVFDGKGCVSSLIEQVNCVTSATCGNGVVELGEQCESFGTATCTNSCQNRVAQCGDGIVIFLEQCESLNTTFCDANCKSIVCGDGVVSAD